MEKQYPGACGNALLACRLGWHRAPGSRTRGFPEQSLERSEALVPLKKEAMSSARGRRDSSRGAVASEPMQGLVG